MLRWSTCCRKARLCCQLSKKFKHSLNHVNPSQHTHTGMYVFTPAKVDWISESHGLTTQCWRAASLMAPGEAEMMDMVCRWEWTLRAWGHRRSTALPPLPSVSTGWAQTHDRAWGNTLQDHLQQHTPHFWGQGGGISARHTSAAQESCPSTHPAIQCCMCSHWIIHSGFSVSSA